MTTTQLTMHAAAQPIARQPVVFLKFQGTQQGFGTLPSRDLYNVVGGDYVIGSTVTIETMKERGFKIHFV
jgi:hypothetical protein